MNCSCWDDGATIIQGDVTIESLIGGNGISYIGDIPLQRGAGNIRPHSAQGLATWDHYAVGVAVNADNSANVVYTIDLSTYHIVDSVSNALLTAVHWNTATVLDRTAATVEVAFAGHGAIQTLYIGAGGQIQNGGRSFASTLAFNGISKDFQSGKLYATAGGKIYLLELDEPSVMATEIIDTNPVISQLTTWVYPGWTLRRQSMTHHNGVFYLSYSHPNTLLLFAGNGNFLGAASLPYTSQGHPLCEIEDMDWNSTYNCFIVQCQGRATDDYMPSEAAIWSHALFFAWGGTASDNWRLEYSTATGDPTNVQAASLKQVYATAAVPPFQPNAGYFIRHTGLQAEPFDFVSDAIFMASELETNSSREECHLILSGDFAAYENGNYLYGTGSGLTIPTELRIVFNADGTKLPRVNVANSNMCSFLPGESSDNCSIERLNCSVNSRVYCQIPVGEIVVGVGAKFTGNNVGQTVLTVSSMAEARFGATNNVFLAGSSMATNGSIIAPASVDMTNVSNSDNTALKLYGVDAGGGGKKYLHNILLTNYSTIHIILAVINNQSTPYTAYADVYTYLSSIGFVNSTLDPYNTYIATGTMEGSSVYGIRCHGDGSFDVYRVGGNVALRTANVRDVVVEV